MYDIIINSIILKKYFLNYNKKIINKINFYLNKICNIIINYN